MLSDKLLQLADGVALNTGAAGNYVIGDQIDLGPTARGIGALVGNAALYLVITVDVAAVSATGTVSFSLLTDGDPTMASPNVVVTTPVFLAADLPAGKLVFCAALPVGFGWERYVGLRQTTGVAAFTAGAVTAIFTPTPPARFHYPQNAAISY